MLDRLAVTLPGWQEESPADVGVALVELLAYAGDHLSYYQDAVATEAYLDTARKRTSVRRHALLLDYQMHAGCNARVWACLHVENHADGRPLASGIQLLTGYDESRYKRLQDNGSDTRPKEIAPNKTGKEQPHRESTRSEKPGQQKPNPRKNKPKKEHPHSGSAQRGKHGKQKHNRGRSGDE